MSFVKNDAGDSKVKLRIDHYSALRERGNRAQMRVCQVEGDLKKFLRMDGSTAVGRRDEMIMEYNENDSFVLCNYNYSTNPQPFPLVLVIIRG